MIYLNHGATFILDDLVCLFVAVVFFFFPKQPGCSLLSGGDVNQERVDSEEEHEVATSQVLEAFKQQKLHLNKIF